MKERVITVKNLQRIPRLLQADDSDGDEDGSGVAHRTDKLQGCDRTDCYIGHEALTGMR
jgi:hypothetical protein